jgi:death-on-curing protein
LQSDQVKFLTRYDIDIIHQDQIKRYGGRVGVRDEGLILSALAQPQNAFGRVEMHPTIYEKAAAYLFHLTSNHPFIDGNKRVGLVAALTFLFINGFTIKFNAKEIESLVMNVANGRANKEEISTFFSKS